MMKAALEIISERGFHDSPIAEIAARAEVAAGTIYRYFESKDVLVNELRQALVYEISTVLLKDYPLDRSLEERFHHIFRGLLVYFIDHPLHFRYLEQYFHSPYGVELHREALLENSKCHNGALWLLFDEGVSHRLLKDLPKPVLLALSMGPLIILMRDHALGFAGLDKKLIGQVTEACWDAIKS